MHHTSDTLYFKEYNLVIKHGLPLKLELTGFIDTNSHAMYIFQQVMSTGLTQTKYVHFNTCYMLITTNHDHLTHKRQHIHYNSQHNP